MKLSNLRQFFAITFIQPKITQGERVSKNNELY